MADTKDERLKPAADNEGEHRSVVTMADEESSNKKPDEHQKNSPTSFALSGSGVAKIANFEKTTVPRHRPTARPEISHNAPPPLPSGEKRKAPSSPDDGGQKKTKPFTMSFGVKAKGAGEQDRNVKTGGITLKVGTAKPLKTVSIKLMQKPKEPELKAPSSKAVAKAFAEESDDEEDEMPPEAKMRMRNVGRDTPTSAGPNSFNKSKFGFNDHARVWKKDVDDEVPDPDKDKK